MNLNISRSYLSSVVKELATVVPVVTNVDDDDDDEEDVLVLGSVLMEKSDPKLELVIIVVSFRLVFCSSANAFKAYKNRSTI